MRGVLVELALLGILIHSFPLFAAGEGGEFDYDGPRGPDHWGELQPEWATCGSGREQSPINIVTSEVHANGALGSLSTDYSSANALLKNRDHDVAIEWPEGGGTLEINGRKYILTECHWHLTTEHAVNGQRYALELHLVHKTMDDMIAVIGVLYEIGIYSDPFIRQFEDAMWSLTRVQAPSEKGLGYVNPAGALMGLSEEYYRYMGSLTTPPCTEGVIWSVAKQVRTVSSKQLHLFCALAARRPSPMLNTYNSRPIQPRNGRIVEVYPYPNLHMLE